MWTFIDTQGPDYGLSDSPDMHCFVFVSDYLFYARTYFISAFDGVPAG